MQEEPPKPEPEVDEPMPEESELSEQDNPAKPGRLDKHKHHWRLFKSWYATHKKWSMPATLLLIVLILAGVPFTRYKLAGLALKKNFSLQITDATAHNPVSGVIVSSGSVTAQTDADGVAVLRLRVGPHKFNVSKKYYMARQISLVVPILKEKNPPFALVATGRQVDIKVTNLITGKLLSGVDINVADTNAKTDSNGNALLVVPAGKNSQSGKLSFDGYNDANVTIQVSDTAVKENDFKLTPVGEIYYISNATGQQNVMKANLDGSQAVVAVAATGNEDSSTALTQSPDGKYVALVAKRTTTDPVAQIYVLAAADDKLLQIDSGNALFSMYGWANDTLIYGVNRQDLALWQQGVGKLKAYDATTGDTTLLDQTAGSDATTNINETYTSVDISGNQVVYSKYWSGDQTKTTGKQNTVQVIGINGQNHAVVASYDATTSVQQLIPHSPVSFYISVTEGSNLTQNYDYTIGSTPKAVTLTSDQLFQNDANFLFSPSGNQTFWTQVLNGKNTLYVGDNTGASPSTVASSSDYSAYGWYTDNYLLLSKDNNELYIVGVKGGTPVKITDYQTTAFGY